MGKTIIFAKNHAHAQFIADRFDKNYPQYKGNFARVIDFQVEYAQSLIDDFSNPARHCGGGLDARKIFLAFRQGEVFFT